MTLLITVLTTLEARAIVVNAATSTITSHRLIGYRGAFQHLGADFGDGFGLPFGGSFGVEAGVGGSDGGVGGRAREPATESGRGGGPG